MFGVTELKIEYVIMLSIVALLLYHFIGRCSCSNGFSVGGFTCPHGTMVNVEILGLNPAGQNISWTTGSGPNNKEVFTHCVGTVCTPLNMFSPDPVIFAKISAQIKVLRKLKTLGIQKLSAGANPGKLSYGKYSLSLWSNKNIKKTYVIVDNTGVCGDTSGIYTKSGGIILDNPTKLDYNSASPQIISIGA